MIRNILTLILVLQVFVTAYAQNEVDALRYAQLSPIGTARYTAMGGAFGALGGDMTTMTTNPAGLGVYRKSDFGLTFGWSTSKINSTFNNEQTKATDVNFDMTNLGFVMANSETSNPDWRYINFGFAYNKLADYNSVTNLKGTNEIGSALDEVIYYFNKDYISTRDILFENAAAVYERDGQYVHDYKYPFDLYGSNTTHTYITEGYVGEYDFSLAANYRDKIYIGGSFGIQSIRYKERLIHKENPIESANKLKYLEVEDYLYTKGNGFNLKLGAIYKINQMVRLGFAFHTPTVYNMRDDYGTSVTTNIDDPEYGLDPNTSNIESYDAEYNYNYVAPMRIIGSGAVVIGKMGLVSAEIEYVDYESMNLSSDEDSFDDVNTRIDTLYKGNFNYKLGAELRLGLFSLRAGGAYYSGAYDKGINSDVYSLSYSGGIGINTGKFYADITYHNMMRDEKYFMYDYKTLDAAQLEKMKSRYMLTFGLRF